MNRKSYVSIAVLALLLMSTWATLGVPAHTFHTSLMQVEYNHKEQLVEISLQVFMHDLESVLSRKSGKVVRLDKTPQASQLTLAYLNETINLKNRDGQTKTLTWVGMEPQADAVWLYVETRMPEGMAGGELRNRIFFDLLDDQVNLVHIKQDEMKYDLVFKPGDGFKAISPTDRSTK